MLFSAMANYFVSRQLFKVGNETDSVALQADGWHLRTDVYTSAGVMVGLLLIAAGERSCRARSGWVDPVAAIVVALLIVKAAWDLTRESLRDVSTRACRRREASGSGELRGHPDVTSSTICAPASPAPAASSSSTWWWTHRCPRSTPTGWLTI